LPGVDLASKSGAGSLMRGILGKVCVAVSVLMSISSRLNCWNRTCDSKIHVVILRHASARRRILQARSCLSLRLDLARAAQRQVLRGLTSAQDDIEILIWAEVLNGPTPWLSERVRFDSRKRTHPLVRCRVGMNSGQLPTRR